MLLTQICNEDLRILIISLEVDREINHFSVIILHNPDLKFMKLNRLSVIIMLTAYIKFFFHYHPLP